MVWFGFGLEPLRQGEWKTTPGTPPGKERRLISAPASNTDEHMAVAQKKRYQNGTLVSGNMDQNLRNPSCLILSHTRIYLRPPSACAPGTV